MAGFGDIPIGDASAFGGSSAVSATPTATPVAKAASVGGPQSGIGKWLVDNAPAIGGTVGGILGLPLNALDAVSGLGGTALDIGAAAGGGAIGKQIQQSVRGNGGSVGQQALNDAGSGAVQGVTQGIAHGAGKLLGFAAKPLLGAADNLVTKATFGGASKATQIANKATSTIKSLTGLGIKPTAIGAAIPEVTGDTGVVSNGVRTALTNSGPVDLTGAYPLAGREADLLDVNKPGSGNAFRQMLNNLSENMIPNGQPVSKVGANTAFDMMKQLEKNGFAKGVDPATRSAFLNVANHIGDQLTKSGADSKVVSGVFQPQDIARLATISPKLAEAAQGAKTVGELRSLQAPFVRANQLLQDAANQGEQIAGKAAGPNAVDAGAALLSHGASIPISAARLALKTPAGEKVVGGAVGTAGKALGAAGKVVAGDIGAGTSAVGKAVAPIAGLLGRFATQSVGQNAAGNGAPAGPATAPVSPTDSLTAGIDQTGTQGSFGSGNQTADTSEYPKSNELADMARDPKNAAYYASLYKEANPAGDSTTNQKNEAAGAQKALSQLADYSNQFAAGGGGEGKIGGYINNILGEFGIGGANQAAVSLSQQRTDVASAVAASLSPRGTAQASITKMIADGLPKQNDPKGVAEDKMNQLVQRIKDGYFTSMQSIDDPTVVSSAAPANQ